MAGGLPRDHPASDSAVTLLFVARQLLIALSLACIAPAAHAQDRPLAPRAARLVSLGERYLEAGDRGSAIAYFRDAISADPFAARAYADLGAIYVARGSLSEARQVYEAGLARMPADATLWLGLARTLDAEGRATEAAQAIRSLLARDPTNVEALTMRADLARRRGAWSEALTAYRALLARGDLDEASAAEARRYEAALRLLARPLDPVSAPRACGGSEVRRALARCR